VSNAGGDARWCRGRDRHGGGRWPVTVLAAAGPLVVLWLVGGAPWWPPAAAIAAGLLVRLLGRIMPRRLHHPIAAGGVVGAVALAPELSVGGWLLLAAGAAALLGRAGRRASPRPAAPRGAVGAGLGVQPGPAAAEHPGSGGADAAARDRRRRPDNLHDPARTRRRRPVGRRGRRDGLRGRGTEQRLPDHPSNPGTTGRTSRADRLIAKRCAERSFVVPYVVRTAVQPSSC
jgi:hypothetical protein